MAGVPRQPGLPKRLNRTSVGLKPHCFSIASPQRGACLNRTSVGLKQAPLGGQILLLDPASIEPAWD